MSILLSVLIVSIGASAPTEARAAAGAEVFRCDFGPSWDKNFDGWPDGWTRENGRGFPSYLKVKMDGDSSPGGGRSLRMELDGGAAVAFSPLIPVNSLSSYVVEGVVKTADLVHDRAYLSLVLLDDKHHRLEAFPSERFGPTQGWKRFRLGPLAACDGRVRYAMIGLHLEPGEQADLKGFAQFADIRIGRLPRLVLKIDSIDHVFTDPGQIEVRCEISGLSDKQGAVDFELLDEQGRRLVQVQRTLTVGPAPQAGSRVPDNAAGDAGPLAGSAAWKPPVPGPGFYTVRATTAGRESEAQKQELTLAVLAPLPGAHSGQFGWILPRGSEPLPLPALGKLLGQVGINWIKYPLWYGETTGKAEIESLVVFGDRLSAQGIEMVGLLNRPPEEVRRRLGDGQTQLAADVFSANSKVWGPSLESVLTRMGIEVRWWQLGDDGDTSFVGYAGLSGKIAQIKEQLDRAGQDIKLGMAWDGTSQLPQADGGKAPWSFLALSADPSLGDVEAGTRPSAQGQPNVERWISLTPLARDKHPVEVRATDLVRRMTMAKVHGADAIFACDPFDRQCGLMNGDGTAGELLLPWRTTALALGGTQCLGSIRLPEGSYNQVFARDNDAVMVVWNDRPTREVLYLGDAVRQVDVWGRSRTPAQEGQEQVIEAGPLPTLVSGLSKPIAMWRMAFAFDRERIPSILGQRQANGFRVKNAFAQDVEVTTKMAIPQGWSIRPQQSSFSLGGGQTKNQPLEVVVPLNEDDGPHKIRVDFEVRADRVYRFSTYEQMDLGLEDVYITVSTRRNGRGGLEVEQRLVNQGTQAVSFRCQLLVPDRRRLATEVLRLGPGSDVKTYQVPDAEELVGKALWLRAAEVDGPRVLNHRFVVK